MSHNPLYTKTVLYNVLSTDGTAHEADKELQRSRARGVPSPDHSREF